MSINPMSDPLHLQLATNKLVTHWSGSRDINFEGLIVGIIIIQYSTGRRGNWLLSNVISLKGIY